MNADDYQKLKDIFNSALDLPPADRSAFVTERCSGNEEMLRRVERLLDSSDSTFLESPAGDPFSETPSKNCSRSGQRIGHYEVIRRIGSGGMGDVYLAVDGKLGRQVAIKILPDEFTTDASRLDRFQLEARSASSLSHPNILTIFEVGEWQGTHYIATEYVEGETLRQRLSRERLSIGESMDLGIQLASGIAAAHEASICHRDIKPENIMIRRDGLLKVVDFGLAKLVASPFRSSSSPTMNDEPTVKIVNTEPGVVMGTVQYMSPEQTRALPTDERSDIWSLGCVLYEMLTGHSPFKGDTSADMVAEIMKTHPELPSRIASDVPERLDEIISKSLEKHPDERYQTAKDLLIDLKRLRRNLELEDTLERSNPGMRTDPVTAVTSGPNIISTKKGPKDLTEVNSAEYLYWGIKAHRWTAIGITLFIIGLVGGTAMLVRYYWRDPEKKPQPFESFTLSRVTTSGKSSSPALSSDGKFLAFVNTEGSEQRIVIRQVATGTDVSIVKPQKAIFIGLLRFSNDSNYLYYVVVDKLMGYLYRVPILGGGKPKKIIEDIDSSIAFSPAGDRLAFVRWGDEITHVMTAGADGSDLQTLYSQEGEGAFIDIDWSPNGERLALIRDTDHGSESAPRRINILSLLDKRLEQLGSGSWSTAGSIRWHPDGKSLTLAGRESIGSPVQVWHVSYPIGDRRPITKDYTDYSKISQIANGQTLALERGERRTSIWSLDLNTKESRQITAERVDQPGSDGIVQLADGSLLISKHDSGRTRLWRLDGDDFRAETQVNDEFTDLKSFSLSPDGRYILASSKLNEGYAIWRMNLDGSEAIPLTKPEKRTDINPVLLSDNKTILYIRSTDGYETRLMKTTIDGDDSSELLFTPDVSIQTASVSPDGSTIAVVSTLIDKGSPAGGSSVRLYKFEDERLIELDRKVDTSQLGLSLGLVNLTPEGSLLGNGEADMANLYRESRHHGKFVKMTDFRDGMIFPFSLSRSGTEVFFIRNFRSSDIFMMTEGGDKSSIGQ